MPLTIELKPFERLIINGAAIRNGERRASFVIETQCKFLRESEIIHERNIKTPCERLCYTLQVIYLTEMSDALFENYQTQVTDLIAAAPSMAPYLEIIQAELDNDRPHKAIKKSRDLIAYEAKLLNVTSI